LMFTDRALETIEVACIASNYRMIDKLENVWQEAIVV
jgi:hypothetical protein